MHEKFTKILHRQVLEFFFVKAALERGKQSTPAPPQPKPKVTPPAETAKDQRSDAKPSPRMGGLKVQKHAAASARTPGQVVRLSDMSALIATTGHMEYR